MPYSRSAKKRSVSASRLLAVVPSDRVTAVEYIANLDRNGIDGILLGRGKATVLGVDGRRRRVVGAVVAVEGRDATRAKKIAQLCGITAVVLDRTA